MVINLLNNYLAETLLVRASGLEPERTRREILSLLCLPFHHARIIQTTNVVRIL